MILLPTNSLSYSGVPNFDTYWSVFIQPSLFNRYHIIHNLEQDFVCDELWLAFCEDLIFNNYQGVYNGEKIYECDKYGNKH